MVVRAVLFDIGNVLIEWQPEQVLTRVLGEDRRAAFFDAVPILEMNERVDMGENFYDAIDDMAARYPDWIEEVHAWRHHWIEMVSPTIDHSVRLLRALRRTGIPVFALSNFGVETLKIAEQEYPFLEEFDRRYISGAMQVMKPDAAIYEKVEIDCGISPQSLLFVDDRIENIEAATLRGWNTHLFEGPQGWAQRLIDEQLLSIKDAE